MTAFSSSPACQGARALGAAPARLSKRLNARLTVKASTAQASQVASVTIKCQYHCEFGQVLKVVGANREVGGWDLGAAPVLTWSEGDLWSTNLELTPGSTLAFKLVVDNGDGSAIWEDGENRVLENVPPDAVIDCVFGATDQTVLDAASASAGGKEAATVVDKPNNGATAHSQPASAAPKASEREVSAERPSSPKPSYWSGSGMEWPRLFKPESSQANGSHDSDSNASDEEPAKPDASSNGKAPTPEPVSLPVTPIAEAKLETKPEQAAPEVAPQSVSQSTETKPLPQSPLAAEVQSSADSIGESVSSTSDVADSSSADALSAVASALCLAGALPVVAWSQYNLISKGCGLPPAGTLLGTTFEAAYAATALFALGSAGVLLSGARLPGGQLARSTANLSWVVLGSASAIAALEVYTHKVDPAKLASDAACYSSKVTSLDFRDQLNKLQSSVKSMPAPSLSSGLAESSSPLLSSFADAAAVSSEQLQAAGERTSAAVDSVLDSAAALTSQLAQGLRDTSSSVAAGSSGVWESLKGGASGSASAWDSLRESAQALGQQAGLPRDLTAGMRDASAGMAADVGRATDAVKQGWSDLTADLGAKLDAAVPEFKMPDFKAPYGGAAPTPDEPRLGVGNQNKGGPAQVNVDVSKVGPAKPPAPSVGGASEPQNAPPGTPRASVDAPIRSKAGNGKGPLTSKDEGHIWGVLI